MNVAGQPIAPEDLFAGFPLALASYRTVRSILERRGPITVRTSKSQVAFRRRRGFAYLWRPGQYLAKPGAEVVLSIAAPRRIASGRFKEVVQPAPATWMHHLEIHDVSELDAEVEGWLAEAADAAGAAGPDVGDRPDKRIG
jgi:uncharacterized protein DUF5655